MCCGLERKTMLKMEGMQVHIILKTHSIMKESPKSQISTIFDPLLHAAITAVRASTKTEQEVAVSHHQLRILQNQVTRELQHSLFTILAAALYFVTTSGLLRPSSRLCTKAKRTSVSLGPSQPQQSKDPPCHTCLIVVIGIRHDDNKIEF